MTNGGCQFKIPFEQNITNLIPCPEGLIIEYNTKEELSYKGKPKNQFRYDQFMQIQRK